MILLKIRTNLKNKKGIYKHFRRKILKEKGCGNDNNY